MRIALAWIDPGDPTDAAVASGLAEALEDIGHEPVLVGPRRLGGVPGGAGRFRFAAAGTVSELQGLLRRFGFDLWHCHVFGRSHRLLTRALKSGRWPMVASLHLVLPDYLAFAGGAAGLGALLRRAKHATAVSAWSLREARLLWPFLRGRSSVVACGVPEALPDARASRVRVPGSPYVFCAARQAPYKGLDILLMAFSRLREKRPDLKLVIAGRDQMAGALPLFAERLGLDGSVVFTGALAPAEVRRLIRGCLFFVLPSRREALGMALLEAMAEGKACVASRVGGIPEAARHGRHALLAPPGDIPALAGAMERLASDAVLRDRLGGLARQRSLRFNWARAAAAFNAIYERILR